MNDMNSKIILHDDFRSHVAQLIKDLLARIRWEGQNNHRNV